MILKLIIKRLKSYVNKKVIGGDMNMLILFLLLLDTLLPFKVKTKIQKSILININPQSSTVNFYGKKKNICDKY